ncbi:synaptonemal complex central element protein 1-like [Trichosurus vulpecula]|uniref:synaptonemal complex central element protein 1-like n=1 Tax=Trichosurus vulpecula TaxID=9337 RepID=UPI00186B22B4|nr:synaptonemal complex central element protein 1-like [Trichosurus vulpecula]
MGTFLTFALLLGLSSPASIPRLPQRNSLEQLMETVAQTFNLTYCWVCGGPQQLENWPWVPVPVSPAQILSKRSEVHLREQPSTHAHRWYIVLGVEESRGEAVAMESSSSVGEDGGGCFRKESEGNLQPRTEDIMSKINELQQAKKIANKELCDSQARRQSLQKELDEVSLEETRLKEILSEKQETLKILHLHCQEKETEAVRQQAVCEGYKKRIRELNSKIQEEKLKKRNQRMEFGEQLEEMMEKNKTLWEFHKADKLSQEISNINNSKEQLLMEERLTQEKLDSVQKQLDMLTQTEAKTEATAVTSVDAFLCSEEAAAAVQLFKEENKKATEFLEAACLRYHQLQQKYERLKRELESVDIRASKETPTAEAAEGESGIVTKSVMELPGTQKKDQEVRPGPGKDPA